MLEETEKQQKWTKEKQKKRKEPNNKSSTA